MGVERVFEQVRGAAACRTPCRGRADMSGERDLVARPARKLPGMMAPGLDLHRTGDERLHDVHRNPRRAATRADLARLDLAWLARSDPRGAPQAPALGFGLPP